MNVSRLTLYNILSGKQELRISDLKIITGILNCNSQMNITNGQEELILIDK